MRNPSFLVFFESYCNGMVTWPHHVISLVILTNNILLSLPIALTYHFVPDSSSFWYTKPHLSIVGNWLAYITLLRSAPATILFVLKCFLRHLTTVSIPTHQHLVVGTWLSLSGSVGIQITPQSLAIDTGL